MCINRKTAIYTVSGKNKTHLKSTMEWLWLVGSIKLQVFFANEPYKRDDILEKRRMISSMLLTVATP